VSRSGASRRLVDQFPGDVGELALFSLADRAQRGERLVGRTTTTADEDANGLVDDRSARQGRLQLPDYSLGLGQDLGVVHRDRRRLSEQLAEPLRVLVERIRTAATTPRRPASPTG
jgi:hypothetical protein